MSNTGRHNHCTGASYRAAVLAAAADREVEDFLQGREGPDPTPILPWRGPVGFRIAEALGGYHLTPETPAQEEARERLEASIPYNMGSMMGETRRECAINARRLEGFFRAIVKHPEEHAALLDAIEATSSNRGVNSPYTTVDWAETAHRWDYNPGRVDRALRAVMWSSTRRAKEMRGLGIPVPRVTWEHVADALVRSRRAASWMHDQPITRLANRKTGRAAVVALASAINACFDVGTADLHPLAGEYRRARAVIRYIVAATKKGRWVQRSGVPTLRTSRIRRLHTGQGEVLAYFALAADGREVGHHMVVVTPDGHHYHVPRYRPYYKGNGASPLRMAIEDALKAFEQRRKALEENADVAAVLAAAKERRVTPVVFFRDSLAVGNCTPGTRGWVRRHLPGFRHAAPLGAVFEKAVGDEIAMRVVHRAAAAFSEAVGA